MGYIKSYIFSFVWYIPILFLDKMPLFVLSTMTATVTLMWSVQLLIPMPLTGITIFLNLWFMLMWSLLAYVYVRTTLRK